MPIMKTSAAGRAKLIGREGVRLHAYYDSVGVLTIGVGHTSAAGPPMVKDGLTITREDCDQILARDLIQFENTVSKCVTAQINQNQFDALVSLCFNIGIGNFAKASLVKKLNSGDVQGAADGFLVWNRAGGKVVDGLTTRRIAERSQFLQPGIAAVQPTIPPPPDVPAPIKPKPRPPATTSGPVAGTIIAGTATAAAAHKAGLTPLQVGLVALAVIALVIGGVVLWRKLKK